MKSVTSVGRLPPSSCSPPRQSLAQSTRSWTGNTANNLWSDIANWDTGIPGTGDIATFATAANNNTNVSLNGAVQPISTLLFSGSGLSFNLGVGTGDIFGFDPVGAITVNAGAGQTTTPASRPTAR